MNVVLAICQAPPTQIKISPYLKRSEARVISESISEFLYGAKWAKVLNFVVIIPVGPSHIVGLAIKKLLRVKNFAATASFPPFWFNTAK